MRNDFRTTCLLVFLTFCLVGMAAGQTIQFGWPKKKSAAPAANSTPPPPPAAEEKPPVKDPLDRSADTVMRLLDNAIWIPDGQASQKQIYVISAPWCPYCQKVYQSTRTLGKKVQLRWIEMSGSHNDSLSYIGAIAQTRDPKLLDSMYKYVNPSPASSMTIAQNADAYNSIVGSAIEIALCYPQRAKCSGFPLLIWLEADGVHAGRWNTNVESILPAIVDRPQAAAIKPEGLNYLDIGYQTSVAPIQNIASGYYFAKWNDVRGHAQADESSPVVDVLNEGRGGAAIGQATVSNKRWIVFCQTREVPCNQFIFYPAAEVELGKPAR